jgi:hypothetical protein
MSGIARDVVMTNFAGINFREQSVNEQFGSSESTSGLKEVTKLLDV